MYTIIASTKNVTPPKIPPIMGSLGVEFVGVLVKDIAMEALEAGVKLLLRVGEGTGKRWNLLICWRDVD